MFLLLHVRMIIVSSRLFKAQSVAICLMCKATELIRTYNIEVDSYGGGCDGAVW